MVSDAKTDLKKEIRALEMVNVWVNIKDYFSFSPNFFK